MFKSAAAALLSISVAFGAVAPTPVQASDADDIARFIFGAAALALIAKELRDDHGKDRDGRPDVHVHRPHNNNNVTITRPGHSPVITPHRPNRQRAVPLSCRRTFETDRGRRNVFGVPCLRREGVNIARLPERCLRQVNLPRRTIDAYAQRCLVNNGVRLVN